MMTAAVNADSRHHRRECVYTAAPKSISIIGLERERDGDMALSRYRVRRFTDRHASRQCASVIFIHYSPVNFFVKSLLME